MALQEQQQSETPEHSPTISAHVWMILGLLCTAPFLTWLNSEGVTLILPVLQRNLGFSSVSLQWVVSASALSFSGGLLVGGRLGDLFGHRRVFILGLILYAISTLLCGFSLLPFLFLLGRVLQGISSALMLPASLALLMDTFPQGEARYRALGVWEAIGPLGGLVGTLGGTWLTDTFGWPWMFFLIVPMALVAGFVCVRLLPHAHEARPATSLDAGGALLSTGGIVLLIAGLTQLTHPLSSLVIPLLLFAGSFVFLLLFCSLEAHLSHPLVPLHFFQRPAIARANLLTLAFSAAANTPIFFFTLYMQQVRGFSAFITGLAFLPANVAVIGGSFLCARLVKQLGRKWTTFFGIVLLLISLFLFSRIALTSAYIWTVLPCLLLLGTGLGIAQVVVTASGTTSVSPDERGLASSVLTMAAQVGIALGLAILVSLATVRTNMLTAHGRPSATALLAGFQWAFYGGAGFALLGILLTLFPAKKSGLQEG